MSGDCNFEISFHSDSDILDDSFEDPDFEPPKTALEESSTEDSEEDIVLKVLQKKKTFSRVNGNKDATTEAFLEENQPKNSKRGVMTAINSLKAVMSELHPDEKRDLLDIPNEELVTYLEEFFRCVVKPDGSVYNALSLGTYYNSIARFFLDKKSLDVRKDAMFSRVTKVLARRQEESAKQGEIPGKNASKAIPQNVLAEVIAKGKIGFDDPRSLTANVIKSFQEGFGIRNREEMYSIQNGDIEIGPLKANGVPEYIELSERITKTRRGRTGQAREYKPRIDSNDEKPANCMVRPFLMLQAKKSSAQCAPDQPLFWTCLNAKDYSTRSVWFANSRMGVSTVGNMVAAQVKAAGFDTKKLKISGSSVRKNMFDSLMENEVPGVYASAHGGHGCLKSKENYVTSKDASKRAISRIIGDSLNGEDPGNFNEIVREERSKASEGVKRIKLMGKENESTECQQNLPEPPLSIV